MTAFVWLPCGGRAKFVRAARGRPLWTSETVADFICRHSAVYQDELSSVLQDVKCYEDIVGAIARAAEAVRSKMPRKRTRPWYEESRETLAPLIAARKRAWQKYLRNQSEESSQ